MKSRTGILARLLIASLSTAVSVTTLPALAAQAEPAGQTEVQSKQVWKGAILMGQMSVDLVVHLSRSPENTWTGVMDVPIQGLNGGALIDVAVSEQELKFSFQPTGSPVRADFALTIGADGKTAEGAMNQMGQSFPVKVEQVTEEEAQVGARRPQTPVPPFPYQSRDVTFKNPNDGTTLAGTLTIPQGDGPFPAAILLTGSGPQDRDETLFGHKPFAVIADHLTRNGIAVLRWDDRGVGGSTGDIAQSTGSDFAVDAVGAIEFLETQSEIDGKRIGIIGHSEGAIVGPIAASARKGIAFLVLLAGPGLPGRDLLIMQYKAILGAAGADADSLKQQVDAQTHLLDLVVANAEAEDLRAAVTRLVQLQTGADDEATLQEPIKTQIDAVIEQVNSPWFKSFVQLDPRISLRKCRSPVLALCGSLDLQVPADENLPEIERAVREGGIEDVTAKKLAGLNHLFQPAQTGLMNEYATIETTFDPTTLLLLTDWIRARVAPN